MNSAHYPVPYQDLLSLQNQLCLNAQEIKKLTPYRKIFTDRKKEFAEYLYSVFYNMPETKKFFDYEQRPGLIFNLWMNWFEYIFTSSLDKQFYAYLWQIGLRHAEVNLDQRFSNLAFSVTRQFCHKIIQAEIPHENMETVSEVIDKLLDLCLLIETKAYITLTFHCDQDVILGIADRVRNPVTVIGGNINRLLKKTAPEDPLHDIYETIMSEVKRLESIVVDTNAYIRISMTLPDINSNSLHDLIQTALESLEVDKHSQHLTIEMDIKSDAQYVSGDRGDLDAVFYYLLKNSIEALPHNAPHISISSSNLAPLHPNKIQVDICSNTRFAQAVQNMEKLFSPSYSPKSSGSGFGLPIVKTALKKNFGSIELFPLQSNVIKVSVLLPSVPDS